MVRRSLPLATLFILAACAGANAGTEPSTSGTTAVHPTASGSAPASPSASARAIDLPRLPDEGVAIGLEHKRVVLLVDLDGRIIDRLPRSTLEYGNGSVPGVVLVSRRRSTYRLDVSRHRLVRTVASPTESIDQGHGGVTLPPPIGSMVDGMREGSWRWAERSPDGSRWLAQWSGECEVPSVFLVRDEERPVSITGARSLAHTVAAFALGWSHDGRAIVQFLEPGCGRGFPHAGVHAFAAPGRGHLVFATRGTASARMWGAA